MSFVRNGLAWSSEQGERKRLARIVAVVCPIFVIVAVAITWTDLPEQKREELEKLPPQLAKVMLKKKEQPKPVVKKEEKKPEPEKPKPEKIAEKPKPKLEQPKPQVAKKPEPKVEPKKPNKEQVAKAREKAKNSGLLAMNTQLSKLSALAETVKLDTPKTVTAKPIARKASDKLANVAKATTRSTGIDEAQLTTASQEISLAARAQTQVAEVEEVAADIAAEEAAMVALAARRTSEEVRKTMDANKSAIYSIYNRALRKKPSLQGVVTPEFTIEENGIVSSCAVVESTLNEPKLESKICNRLRLVNFGSQPGVDSTTIRYPIELLPG